MATVCKRVASFVVMLMGWVSGLSVQAQSLAQTQRQTQAAIAPIFQISWRGWNRRAGN
jgi:hypothetical protein